MYSSGKALESINAIGKKPYQSYSHVLLGLTNDSGLAKQ